MPSKGTIPRTCLQCGTLFMAWPAVVKMGSALYCSRTCLGLSQRSPREITGSDIARFWSKVDRSGGPDACWPWTAGTDGRGYGVFTWRKQRRTATRFVWEMVHGRPPEHFACHHCDNPPCVNPAHLYDGTQDDNMEDAAQKQRTAHGERNGMAILTEEQVLAIRAEFVPKSRQFGSTALGKKYGISRRAISLIVRRETWRNI